MAIRPATLQDRKAIVELALEQCERYPLLKVDKKKVFDLVTDAISSAKHFCMVAEDRGSLAAVLIGLTGNNLWAQRQFCSITLWYSLLPGAGAELLRQFKQWVLSRPVIRVAGISLDLDVDPRALKLAERIGFQRQGGSYLIYTRGMRHGIV